MGYRRKGGRETSFLLLLDETLADLLSAAAVELVVLRQLLVHLDHYLDISNDQFICSSRSRGLRRRRRWSQGHMCLMRPGLLAFRFSLLDTRLYKTLLEKGMHAWLHCVRTLFTLHHTVGPTFPSHCASLFPSHLLSPTPYLLCLVNSSPPRAVRRVSPSTLTQIDL